MPWRAAEPAHPKLVFRSAMEEEACSLKALYENAWGRGITIDEGQIRAKIRAFPQGQIVGCEPDSGKPISMINIMLTVFDPSSGFHGGYERVTGGRTFSTHMPIEMVLDYAEQGESIPVALCVSIAVVKEHAKNGYALETLNHAIGFAEDNGLVAVPYSAPRGFAMARDRNPGLDIETYLHMTVPSGMPHGEHMDRIRRLNSLGRVSRAFMKAAGRSSIVEVSETIYGEYQAMGTDEPGMSRGDTAYFRFFAKDGEAFFNTYGRYPLIEDFCILSGRKLLDPVMRMHVDNGARFIRDQDANLSAVFGNSRPEDRSALGYNVLLTYGYHRLLGQSVGQDFFHLR